MPSPAGISGSGNEGYQALDRGPSLPPDVQPSTFNQLAGQQDPSQGAGPSAGGMQIATIIGQMAMGLEMALMKLAALVPGSEGYAQVAQQAIRQIAVSGLAASGAGGGMQPPSPDMGALAGPQGPAASGPSMGGAAGPPPGLPMM